MAGDGGDFGAWSEDEAGLPVFEVRLDALAGDVWHQVGNDRVTATTHADGRATLYWFEEGLVRLGSSEPPARVHALRFGCGWAEWRWRTGELEGVRWVWAPFGDAPGLRIDVELSGALGAAHTETWRFTRRADSATRPCWSKGNGGCDDSMKLRLSSSGWEARPAKGEPARVGSEPGDGLGLGNEAGAALSR